MSEPADDKDHQLELAHLLGQSLAAQNNALRLELQSLRDERDEHEHGNDFERRQSQEMDEAKIEMLEKKLESLNKWADDAADKLKRGQTAQQNVEAENAKLRTRVGELFDASELLKSQVATLEDVRAGRVQPLGSSERGTPVNKRLAHLEETLSAARESLKRKREREKLLIKRSTALEGQTASLQKDIDAYQAECQDLGSKLGLAMQGMTLADGLHATVAKPFSEDGVALNRLDTVTVLAIEGDRARIVHHGQRTAIPLMNLACVGIPLLQYVELIVPERSERERMLEKWLSDAGVLKSATPLRRRGMVRPLLKESDSVKSVRERVDSLLHDIDQSFSEPSSPFSISTLTTPRAGPVCVDSRDSMMEELMSNVVDLSNSANSYAREISVLNKESAPLMQSLTVSTSNRTRDMERKVVNLERELASMDEAMSQSAGVADQTLPDVQSLVMNELAYTSSNLSTFEAGPSADQLQLQMDLTDSEAQREKLSLELKALEIELERLRGADAQLVKERGHVVLLQEKIRELSVVEERMADLKVTVDQQKHALNDLEGKLARSEEAVAVAKKEVTSARAEAGAQMVAPPAIVVATDSEASNSSRKPNGGLFGKLGSGGSKRNRRSAPPTSQNDANDAALKEARAELDAVERKLSRSPRGPARSGELIAERDRIRAEIQALENLPKSGAHVTAPLASKSPTSSQSDLLENDATLLRLGMRNSVSSSLNQSMTVDEDELSKILAGVVLTSDVLTPEQTAERFVNDETRSEELQRRSQVLSTIPGVKVSDPSVDSLKEKLAAAEDRNAHLAADLAAERAGIQSSQTQNIKRLEYELAASKKQHAELSEKHSATSRDLYEKVRRLEFELDEARTRLHEEKETKARIEQSEEASKMSFRADKATLERRVKELELSLCESKEATQALREQLASAKGVHDDAKYAVLQATTVRSQEHKETASRVKDLETESEALSTRLAAGSQMILELHQKNNTLTEENAAMKKRLDEGTLLITELHEKNKVLGEESSAVKTRLEQSAGVSTQLQEKNKVLEGTVAELEGSLATLEKKMVISSNLLKQLQADNAKLKQAGATSDEFTKKEAAMRQQMETQQNDIGDLESRIGEATQLIESMSKDKRELEGRLSKATKMLEDLLIANKNLEASASKESNQLKKQAEAHELEMKTFKDKYAKLIAALREMTNRHNSALGELKDAEKKRDQQQEMVGALQSELARQADAYEELDRVKNPTPQKPRGRLQEDEDMSAQLSALRVAVDASPEQAVVEDKDFLRRQASLDVREARIEAREALASKLEDVSASLAGARDSAEKMSRALEANEVDLESGKIMMQELDVQRAVAVEKAKEANRLYERQQVESQNMISVMQNQCRQLQTEKVELKRLLDTKIPTDAQHAANLEVRCRLLAEQATQTDEDHRQRAKFLKEELASETRLRETYELVNGTLKASVARLERDVASLRRLLTLEQEKSTAFRVERDQATERSDTVLIDKNMYQRITAKLEARVGDSESSDDELRSKVELELREQIASLKERVEHENKRKHQLFETVEDLRKELAVTAKESNEEQK